MRVDMNDILVYQAYYKEEQLSWLDPAFIPFDNLENLRSELREYPLKKKLFHKLRDSDAYWGLVSDKWAEKTHLDGAEFIQWIRDNPGYDVYHIDPSLDTAIQFPNLWLHGLDCHKGGDMVEFANKLFKKIDIDIDASRWICSPNDFATTSYHIGNDKFWKEWHLFVDNALVVCSQDEELYNFLYKTMTPYEDYEIPMFSYVHERLMTMFFVTHRHIKVLKFPFDHPCFVREGDYEEHQSKAALCRSIETFVNINRNCGEIL